MPLTKAGVLSFFRPQTNNYKTLPLSMTKPDLCERVGSIVNSLNNKFNLGLDLVPISRAQFAGALQRVNNKYYLDELESACVPVKLVLADVNGLLRTAGYEICPIKADIHRLVKYETRPLASELRAMAASLFVPTIRLATA